jgi:GNAT superfamily N-acetyltransferase
MNGGIVNISLAKSDDDLEGILQLHSANLRSNLSREEAIQEGFISAVYSMDDLRNMQEHTPAVIAKAHADNDSEIVVGYALAVDKNSSLRRNHPLLCDLFDSIDALDSSSVSLSGGKGGFADMKYVVVGQLCVAKGFRSQGVAQRMYAHFKATMSGTYQCCFTDVSSSNPRSLQTHLKAGFRVISQTHYGDDTWNIVLWEWNKE